MRCVNIEYRCKIGEVSKRVHECVRATEVGQLKCLETRSHSWARRKCVGVYPSNLALTAGV